MKKEYIIFTNYGGIFDGYLWIPKDSKKIGHDLMHQKEYATLFTLKQAQKICFDKNKELRETYSYGRIWGYVLLSQAE
jgi:hypothetical protein